MSEIRVPPPIAPGAVVAIVAPSGPAPREELFRGLAWLRTRYELSIDQRVLERTGYLAGSDEARAAVLARAMLDPRVDAIVCARGGYGAMRILDALPWDEFGRRPKLIVGFSDVTALHLALSARGIRSIHGPNVTGLGREISAAERISLLDALEDRPLPPWRELEVVVEGEARGPLVGGNLALVDAMAASGRLSIPRGAILALEDVGERPYRIDRMLTSLLLSGLVARLGGIVFGSFTDCSPGPDGVGAEDVVRERTRDLPIPVVIRAPFGHGATNRAFHLRNREVELRRDTLEWGSSTAAPRMREGSHHM
jgi:muramoyltetrapeptide carboxypeptidase